MDDYQKAYEAMLKNPVAKLGSFISPQTKEKPLDIKYTTIELERTRLPRCMSCDRLLKPGESHWFYKEHKNNQWWCKQCFKKQCGFTP